MLLSAHDGEVGHETPHLADVEATKMRFPTGDHHLFLDGTGWQCGPYWTLLTSMATLDPHVRSIYNWIMLDYNGFWAWPLIPIKRGQNTFSRSPSQPIVGPPSLGSHGSPSSPCGTPRDHRTQKPVEEDVEHRREVDLRSVP